MRIEQLANNHQDISPKKEVEKAAKEFESFFVYYLLKVMRESVPKSGLLAPGMGSDIYTSMLDEKIAEGVASRGGLGLSHLLIRQLIEEQQNKNDPVNVAYMDADNVAITGKDTGN